ncbi:MAG: hypothetical protein JST19_00325 [Bacteroidetes bacterium]|nr:hypothetical protein [Bacteroidota bacterium]
MKYILLLVMLPLFAAAQSAEQNIQGLWVKVKAEMKDGSRIVDHHGCGMDFIKYTFGADGMANVSQDVLFDDFIVRYSLKKDSLIIGATLYDIISLTKDTLKLSFFVPGAEDKQLPVYIFAKVQQLNPPATATFNVVLKDSVYQANNVLFPVSKDSFNKLMYGMATRFDDGTLKMSFIIDKKGHLKQYTVLEADSVSGSVAKIAGNAFGDLSWVPARKNNLPVNTLVQVTLKLSHKNYVNTLNIQYPFLRKAPYPPIDADEAEAAQQYFKDAINQLNSGHSDKALELVGKCIEIDNIYLNAYELRAFINNSLGKPKEACKDWSILAGLGQVEAAQKLAKYCKN